MSEDLFTVALDARDKRIARLERQLTEAQYEIEVLQAEIARRSATVIVTGQLVALFPSTRRVEYIDRAVDQISRFRRPDARENLIRQRVEETMARLIRNGVSKDAARKDAAELAIVLRQRSGLTSFEGGRGT